MPILQHGIQVKRLSSIVLVEGLMLQTPNREAAGLISTKVSNILQFVDYFTSSLTSLILFRPEVREMLKATIHSSKLQGLFHNYALSALLYIYKLLLS